MTWRCDWCYMPVNDKNTCCTRCGRDIEFHGKVE